MSDPPPRMDQRKGGEKWPSGKPHDSVRCIRARVGPGNFEMDLPLTGSSETIGLYLDLMKRVLTDLVYVDDPLSHLVLYKHKPDTPIWKRQLISIIERVLRRYRLQLVEQETSWQEAGEETRALGRDWPARAHTMIGLKRLDNLQFCVESVLRSGVPGDLIETGVWRGGSCIFMRAILRAYGEKRRCVWVADSFRGLPPPSVEKYAADAGDIHHVYDYLAVSRAQVEQTFKRYNLLDDQVRFLDGWFKDTLPEAPIDRLSVIRLDGDMYESTITALEALYGKLSPGGFVIIDDYFLKPCAEAVRDFRDSRKITDPIRDIDGQGAFWQHSAGIERPTE